MTNIIVAEYLYNWIKHRKYACIQSTSIYYFSTIEHAHVQLKNSKRLKYFQ